MKLSSFSFAVICLFVAATICAAQDAPANPTTDPNQSTQQSQTPTPSPAPSTSPAPASGQPNPPADKVPAAKPDAKKDGQGVTASSSNDRLFFALPNFLTVDKNGKIIPLTSGQKFKIVARGAFDPVQIPWYGILSAIGQAQNSEPGYGQGWDAYGKRLGTYAADGTIENFFVGAIMPSILHQDPRFFPSGKGSFIHRAGYAASRIVITRGDSGKSQFNASEVFGSAISASISTFSYHPHPGYHPIPGEDVPYVASDRTLSNAASVWVSQMGYDAITIALKEFWPDIRRKIKKQPKPAAVEATGASN